MSNHFQSTSNSNVTSPWKTAATSQQRAMSSHNTPPPQNVASWQPFAQTP